VRRVTPKGKHVWERDLTSLGDPIASKTDAQGEAERLKTAIRRGDFGSPQATIITLRQLADLFHERYRIGKRSKRQIADITLTNRDLMLKTICRTLMPQPDGTPLPFGAWRIIDIVTDTVERFREVRLAESSQTAGVGVNRQVRQLRELFNWAILKGYMKETPFKIGTETAITLAEEAARSRRLDADTDEGDRLLKACGPYLRAVVEAALETGMRRGEILSLQWSQVDGLRVETKDDGTVTFTWSSRPAIVLPWTKTKTRTERRIPISARLRPILEMRRCDPKGRPLTATCHVFGDELGQPVASFKRAWESAVLKAHDHKPQYVQRPKGEKTTRGRATLTPECRATLRTINLHFHDLRREAGSRWLDGGVPLHSIKDWLGHTNIAQTSTYLQGTLKGQHDQMREFDERRGALQTIATSSRTGSTEMHSPASEADTRTPETLSGSHVH
jgi:integrase